jgi:hypothetical protein
MRKPSYKTHLLTVAAVLLTACGASPPTEQIDLPPTVAALPADDAAAQATAAPLTSAGSSAPGGIEFGNGLEFSASTRFSNDLRAAGDANAAAAEDIKTGELRKLAASSALEAAGESTSPVIVEIALSEDATAGSSIANDMLSIDARAVEGVISVNGLSGPATLRVIWIADAVAGIGYQQPIAQIEYPLPENGTYAAGLTSGDKPFPLGSYQVRFVLIDSAGAEVETRSRLFVGQGSSVVADSPAPSVDAPTPEPTAEAIVDPGATETALPVAPAESPTAEAPAAPAQDERKVIRAQLARGVDSDNQPVQPGSDFPADARAFYLFALLSESSSKLPVGLEWRAVDVGSAAEPNYVFARSEPAVPGGNTIITSLTLNKGAMPPGKYAVRILVDGDEAADVPFTVGAGAPDAAPADQAQATPAAPAAPSSAPGAAGEVAWDFRPQPDGFGFENYGGEYPNEPADLDLADLRKMFGDKAVCAAIQDDGTCVPAPAATRWLETMLESANGGHCEGMAVLSMRIKQGKDAPSAFGGTTAFDIQKNAEIRKAIAYYYVSQGTPAIQQSNIEYRDKSPKQVLDDLSAILKNPNDPVRLGFFSPGWGGHAVVPYAIKDIGGGVFHIMVYDNNHPGKEMYMVVDVNADQWTYSAAALNPSEDPKALTGGRGTLVLTPNSLREGVLPCPWCGSEQTFGASLSKAGAATSKVVLGGEGHALITNDKGQRIGYDGATFVNEIPGAVAVPIYNGRGDNAEPMYVIPSGMAFNVAVNSRGGASTQDVSVAVFGNGAFFQVDNLTLESGKTQQMEFDALMRELDFLTASTSTVNVIAAIDTDSGADVQYAFQELSFNAGQNYAINLNGADGKATFGGAMTADATFGNTGSKVTVSSYTAQGVRERSEKRIKKLIEDLNKTFEDIIP